MLPFISRAAILLGLFVAAIVKAEPYRPTNDAAVLERLPFSPAESRNLKQLRNSLQASPNHPELAIELARHYIRLGRTESDPRHFAHAEALVKPWLSGNKTLPDALLLRATVLQNRHDFDAARADLNQALSINSRMPDAWLTLAAIDEAQGRSRSAVGHCLRLIRLTPDPIGTVCLYSALSRIGQAETAYERLSDSINTADADNETVQWIYGVLADLAERLGRSDEAESWYLKAMSKPPISSYLLTVYADFLLAHGRPADVIEQLKGRENSDPLLLRLALAEQTLRQPDFDKHRSMLQARFEAAAVRGDNSHQGDQARFALFISARPQFALALAKSNWTVQREPSDALILVQAALAAKRRDELQPILDFLAQTHLEDRRLTNLLQSFD